MSIKIEIYSNKGKKKNIYLDEYIERNSDILRKKYIRYIEEISNYKVDNKKISDFFKINDTLNLWNCSQLVEKNILKSDEIIDCIKFIAISKIIQNYFYKNKNKKVITYCLNKNLIFILNYKFPNINFNHKKIHKTSIIYQIKKIILNNWFFSFVFFLYYLIRNQLLIKKKNVNYNKKNLIISYFCHYDKDFLKKKYLLTNHWQNLKKYIKKKNFYILNFFIPDKNFKNLRQLVRRVKNNKVENCQPFNFIDFYFDFGNLIRIIKYSIFSLRNFNRLQLQKKFIKNKEIYCIYLLSLNQLKCSLKGYTAFNNIYIYFCFFNFFNKNKKIKNIFYLMENFSWEKILLNFSYKKNITTYGYIHSTMPYWLLNYYNSESYNNAKKNLPDNILTSSKINIKQLRDQKIPSKKIRLVESTRYSWLDDFKKLKKRDGMIVFGDYSKNLNLELIKFIKNFLVINKDIKIYFKNHPAQRYDYDFNNNRVKIIDSENKKYLYDYYLFSNSTSAAAEYAHVSCNINVINAKNYLNMSPFKNINKYKKFFVSDVHQLNSKIIKNVNNKKTNNYFFHINKSLRLWKKII